MLHKLEIENYKSLHKTSIELPKFATLVGANAAGKSNFADAIEFLAIVAKQGLRTAVDQKGGYENICFRRARRAKGAIRFFLDLGINTTGVLLDEKPRKERSLEFRFQYDFAFKAIKQAISSGYTVFREYLRISVKKSGNDEKGRELVSYDFGKQGKSFKVAPDVEKGFLLPSRELLASVLETEKKTESHVDLLLTSRLRGLPPFLFLLDYLENFRVFQILPSSARRPTSASGTFEIGKHGDNLPTALSTLKRDHPQQFALLLDYLKLAVPSVQNLETDYVETRELGLFLKEQGVPRRFYASELSDGTLRTIGIFLPLVDPRYNLVLIVEPENAIHPWVIRHFVDVCRECSKTKQIILTTHSPVLVLKLEPQELFTVEKIEGQTTLQPATSFAGEAEEVIRKGIMDLGSYWDSGAMRAVPVPPTQLQRFGNEEQ